MPKEYLVYINSNGNLTPIAILYGEFRMSNENFESSSDNKSLEIREINSLVNSTNSKDNSNKQKIQKDIREVMEDPNQTEIVGSPNTILPFNGGSAETYYLLPKSILQARGSLQVTQSGTTQTKNGLHVIYIDGNARLFILYKTVNIFVINANLFIDIDCKDIPELGQIRNNYKQILKTSPSIESIVSARSLHMRKKNSLRRRTIQFVLYQSSQEDKKQLDVNTLSPMGYIVGDVCKQQMIRNQSLPTLTNPKRSIRFVLVNTLDPKIRKDINFLESNPSKSCKILGSGDSNIIIYGCSGSGFLFTGYWSVIALTNKVQVVRNNSQEQTLNMVESDYTVVKFVRGSVEFLIDSQCSYLIVDPSADFSVDKYQSFDNQKVPVDNNKIQ